MNIQNWLETNGSSMWREELNQFAPIKVKIMKKVILKNIMYFKLNEY